MPTVHLTDLSVKSLKPSEKHVTYWSASTPGFGIRVGKRSRTWTVMRGRTRERVSIGQYPDISLADARREALRLLCDDSPISDRPKTKTFKEARTEFLAEHYAGNTSRWPHLVKIMLEKDFQKIEHKQLAEIDDSDIATALAKLAHVPSQQLHVYRAVRTFLKWCTRPPRKYLKQSPMDGYPPPSTDRKGTRTLTDDELCAVWNACNTGSRLAIRLLILWGTRNEETCSAVRAWRRNDLLTIPGSHTKNGRDHSIPLLPLASAILDARPNAGAFYFPGRHSDEVAIAAGSLNRMKIEIQQETGNSGWTLRDIRHISLVV
ncbi:MAG: integrase family protein [Sphingomonadales bacterium]